MSKIEIRNIAIIWIVAIVLSIVCGATFHLAWGQTDVSPTATDATTSWFFAPATTLAEMVHASTAWTMVVILPFFFAPVLMVCYAIFRFGRFRNPIAADFHENTRLEIFWSVIPTGALILMAIPAFKVLYYMDTEPETVDQVVDITGYQFYWQYDFPKYGVTVVDDGTGDDPLVLPVDQAIVLHGQSPQVNHAWWVPAFGLKFDVIPGRINSGWIRPNTEGFFKGQCAELCGTLHAYMWIHVKVVPEKEFYEWLREKGAEFPEDEIPRIAQILGEDPLLLTSAKNNIVEEAS
jgi:cytochrome c oxidase subunit II